MFQLVVLIDGRAERVKI